MPDSFQLFHFLASAGFRFAPLSLSLFPGWVSPCFSLNVFLLNFWGLRPQTLIQSAFRLQGQHPLNPILDPILESILEYINTIELKRSEIIRLYFGVRKSFGMFGRKSSL